MYDKSSNYRSAQNLTINASSEIITQSANNETYGSLENDNSSLNNYQKSQTFTHGIIVEIDSIDIILMVQQMVSMVQKMHLVTTGDKMHLIIFKDFITILVHMGKNNGGHLMQKVMNYYM